MTKSKRDATKTNTPAALNRSYGAPEVVIQRQRTVAALAPKVGEQVLDVGCGTGFLTRELAVAVGTTGKITAIDHSEAMVDAARKSCNGWTQVTVATGDVAALEFADATFDGVTCTQVLLYVEDTVGAISEMSRVLKPGGRLAILETDWRTAILHSPDPATTAAVFAAWDDAVPSPNLPVYLRPIMDKAAISVETVEAIPLLNTRYDPTNFSASSLDWLSRIGIKAGVFDREGAMQWIEGIRRFGEDDNNYFFCVNRFLFCGVRRDEAREIS